MTSALTILRRRHRQRGTCSEQSAVASAKRSSSSKAIFAAAPAKCTLDLAAVKMRLTSRRAADKEFEVIDNDLLEFLESRPQHQYRAWVGYHHHAEHARQASLYMLYRDASVDSRSCSSYSPHPPSPLLHRYCRSEVPDDIEEFSEADWQYKLCSILSSLDSTTDLLLAIKLAALSTWFDTSEEVCSAEMPMHADEHGTKCGVADQPLYVASSSSSAMLWRHAGMH